jgi:peptidoglycan/LPS O-acetylase OafA/YrhL
MSWLPDILYPVNRWLHMVCSMLIVGGTLFFELVLPAAIDELKREQQLYVFARARWVFRWVVWIGVVGLLLSGGIETYRMWRTYQSDERVASALTSASSTQPAETSTAPARRTAGDDRAPASFWYVSRWALAHIILGGVAMLIALFLTIGRRPPEDPVRWMRLNFVILLVVIFLGSATRHFHVSLRERQYREGVAPPGAPPLFYDEDSTPASQPATRPATQASV